jgi:hypothetical protein
LSETDAERLEILRETVRRGPHARMRRLQRMFKNFEGPFAIDPNLPGIREAVLQTASDNKNLVRGASRTMVYAMKLMSDQRFELIGVNQPYQNSLGKSDIDLNVRHVATGKVANIEVKDWSPDSQRANLAKAERQFRMMAEERSKGSLVEWANRRPVIPEIEALGRKYQVPVFRNIATGKSGARPDHRDLQFVLDHLNGKRHYPLGL